MTCVTTERLSDPPSVCRYNVLPAPSLNRPFLYAPYKATMKLVSPKLLPVRTGPTVHRSRLLRDPSTVTHGLRKAEPGVRG